jgi:hypothetical protein
LAAMVLSPSVLVRSGGRTRTGDTAIMSRLLYRLSYTAAMGIGTLEPHYGIEP